jgi:YgiT-type zinc finger domain-containing protein
MKTESKRSDTPEKVIQCRECQAGQMHRQFVVYYTWIGDDLITVPDFPAWVCDVCGRREYDPQALNRLSLILSPNAGNGTPYRRHVHKPSEHKPKGPQPSQPD